MGNNFTYTQAPLRMWGVWLFSAWAALAHPMEGVAQPATNVSSGAAGNPQTPAALMELPGNAASSPTAPPTFPAVSAQPGARPSQPVAVSEAKQPVTGSSIPPAAPLAPLQAVSPSSFTGTPVPSAGTPPPASGSAGTAIPAQGLHLVLQPTAVLPKAVTPVAAAPVAAASGIPTDPAAKKTDTAFSSVHMGDESMMFPKSDMEILKPFMEAYDNIRTQNNSSASGGGDDLTSLIESLNAQSNNTGEAIPKPLPNLYLGSILYYSPSHWSVWINGRKLVYSRNQPENEFFISEISRKEIVLVWKPKNFLPARILWQQLTENGKHPLQDIAMDNAKKAITLHMHTNQTFLPGSLALREGLIKSAPPSQEAARDSIDTGAPVPASPANARPQNLLLPSSLPAIPLLSGEMHK